MEILYSMTSKEKIIEAAILLFSQFGYDSTSTRDVADSAQVSLALIEHHFGSKKGLYDEVVNQVVAIMSE